MKIALDATYSLGDDLTGVGVYSRELLLGMAKAHTEVELTFCYRPHRFFRSFRTALPRNCRRGLLQEPWGPRSADLFHGLNQRLPDIRLRHAVSTFHDLFVLTGEYSTPEFRSRFAEQARRAAAESEAIIAVSSFTADQIEQVLGVEPSRIHVVHHGVAVRTPVPVTRERVILHVGAIQKRKNIGRLVKAFETIEPSWRLVLAGSAGYGADEILRQIEDSPSRRRIEILGYVSAGSLAEWYARATIFAFPSLDEGFGMPVLEAMASGVPVVTSNRSALPEVAGDAAILVNPEDIGEIAGALRSLVQDDTLREKLTELGLQRARRFRWSTAVERTWAVYERLLNVDPHRLKS